MRIDSVLYEVSWEVCNKQGGIFTVISSKVPYIVDKVRDYYMVGPYFESSKKTFYETEVPQNLTEKVKELESMGIKVHFGTTDISGDKNVILVDYMSYSENIDDIKKKLWKRYEIDSLNSDWHDYDEAILWSWCCGIVIEKLNEDNDENVLVHAHEWMSGGTILYFKMKEIRKFKCIFTTHATMLGRTISSHGEDLRSIQNVINPQRYAYDMGVHTKHQTERVLAHISDCFTTVSDVTNNEARALYGKEADVLLYNGFNNQNVDGLAWGDGKFRNSREITNHFIELYFSNFYEIDTSKTKIFYTSGRNEFRNKGYDIYIKALSRLNEKLKNEKSEMEVLNFFIVIIGDFELNSQIFDSTANYNEEKIDGGFKTPLSTHCIEEHDIIRCLRENGLENCSDDKVRNILIPVLLDGSDRAFNREYYEFISGCDLGVFPSYYEPWGYTPLESISFSVPAITSNLAGFGQTIESVHGSLCSGALVLDRINCSEECAIDDLCFMLDSFLQESDEAKSFRRGVAKKLALKYDWSVFIENYLRAYDFAIKKL